MKRAAALLLCIFAFAISSQAQIRKWTIQLEEPTGIERRDNEIVRVDLKFDFQLSSLDAFRLLDLQSRELPLQIAPLATICGGGICTVHEAKIMFPASLIPGERPVYTLIYAPQLAGKKPVNQFGGEYKSDLIARAIATSRFEIANSRFQIIINLGKNGTTPAIVEAYNKTAGNERMVNLVETSPDLTEPLAFGERSAGWGTTLGREQGTNRESGIEKRASGFTDVAIIESGPLRARVRMSGARLGDAKEVWEFEWYAGSPVLIWRTRIEKIANKEQPTADHRLTATENYGFFFSAISASPYIPFTHWMVGKEIGFPDGWETDNPPHKLITQGNPFTSQPMIDDIPGGHVLYYNPKANYGALSFYELDGALKWSGIGGRQFYATKNLRDEITLKQTGTAAIKRREVMRTAGWSSQIAFGFPEWKGTETILNARADYRRFAQPLLARITDAGQLSALPKISGAEREAVYRIENLGAAPKPARIATGDESSGKNPAATNSAFSLNGNWRLQHTEKGEGEAQKFYEVNLDDSRWQTVKVPGSVHTQILNYPAYFRREAEWISFKEWWYRKSFRPPAAMKGKRLRLQFDATDYYADIWLNGKFLGRHEGYIDPYAFEISDKLNWQGDNQLTVRVWTPVDYYWRHRPYTIKGSYGAVDQKPDDITPLGITRSVRLIANDAVMIDAVVTRPTLNKDGSADLDVEVALDNQSNNPAQLELTLAPRNFTGNERLKATALIDADTDKIKVRFHLAKPELWWTWDHGKANLYTLTTRVKLLQNRDQRPPLDSEREFSDEREQAVGIRSIEHVNWNFYLNGRRMFIRGTNSYYLELFMSEMTRQKYERDLALMKSLNINMIRLHCHFQNPEFYELCDELGILVWQDYLEAWYPEDTEFALKAARLYDPHIRYVQNHPCIAIWATSDEESLENYRVLTKHLAGRLAALDVEHRPVARSTGRFGDAHVYEGWYGGTIWEYTKTQEKFISELGATALPNIETLKEFLPNHWPIENHQDDWVFHKLQIFEALRAWGKPDGKTLEEYIPQTQAYVARLHQLAIERLRRRKYDAGGILHFHAIDFWHSVTMAAIDYFRRPTKSYYAVQRAFQMVLPSLEYDKDKWQVGEELVCGLWIINDHWFSIPEAKIQWRIIDAQANVYANGERALTISEDSSLKLEDLKWKTERAGKYELRAEVFDKAGTRISENIYEFEVH
ncbi:MAG: sugar-binding domain-containing protein [Acidobacteriota bacterium]